MGRRSSPNLGGHQPGTSQLRNKKMQKARAEQVCKMTIKGLPATDIGAAFGITDRYVRTIINQSDKDGTLDRVVQRMQDVMSHVPGVYERILTATPEDLSDDRKVHELKLKAAESLSKAVGPHRHTSATISERRSIDLDEFFRLRAARAGQAALPAPVIDAEETPNAPAD